MLGRGKESVIRYETEIATSKSIRTRFLELGGNKEALAAKHLARVRQGISESVWWHSLKEELERRIGPGFELRESILKSKELSNLYRDTVDQILQLMERVENGEVEL